MSSKRTPLRRRQEASTSPPKKRTRQPAWVTRAQLLDATEHVMAAEGYAAVTTRRIAAQVGLTPALVHYYYPTTDDLLLATYRRAVERQDERIRQALESDRPLHALWRLLTDSRYMAVGEEFAALSNHRKHIQKEIAKHDEHCRRFQAKVLSSMLAKPALDAQRCSPLCAVMLIDCLSRSLVIDKTLGLSYGHAELESFVERMLDGLERNRGPGIRLTASARTTANGMKVGTARKAGS